MKDECAPIPDPPKTTPTGNPQGLLPEAQENPTPAAWGRTGKEILEQVLEMGPTGVARLSCEDFFWLVAKIGPEDCLPLLELASTEQWQYLLDLEIWHRDRPLPDRIALWIRLLHAADPARLARWLFTEGGHLAYYHLYRSLEVVIEPGDEGLPPGEGFFTLDGVFHVRVRDERHRETLESLLRTLAHEDFSRYQSLLVSLAGVLPAELEEEMYRLRSVRLAEHGFLPYEEAIAVYAPLEPAFLQKRLGETADPVVGDPHWPVPIPTLPMVHGASENLFMQASQEAEDPVFRDRIRLEFAGLANQLLAADGLESLETEDLAAACKRGARILNLALEVLCGRDLSKARRVLEKHALVNLFRVGYGMVLKVKREAEKWAQQSWYHSMGLTPSFWGEAMGNTLEGLLARRPLYFSGREKEGPRDFEWLEEIRQCTRVLQRLMILDGLLQRLAQSCPQEEGGAVSAAEDTYDRLIVTYWARIFLGLPPSFQGISPTHARALLHRLREHESAPPYQMKTWRVRFIRDLSRRVATQAPETAPPLEEALGSLWDSFAEEVARLPLEGIDGRYLRTLGVLHGRGPDQGGA